jgi:hypothetical protein
VVGPFGDSLPTIRRAEEAQAVGAAGGCGLE